jgi:hypothetical protein
MSNYGFWSKSELQVLKRNYKNHSTRDVAAMLGLTEAATRKKASRMGLKKNKTYRREVLHHHI